MIERCWFGEPVELYATVDRGWRCSSSSGMDSIRNFFRHFWPGFVRESRCGSTPTTWANLETFIVFPDSLQMHRSWSSKTRNHAGPNRCASITSKFASFGNIPSNSLYDESRLLSIKFFANPFSWITNRYVKEDWAGNRDLRDPEQTPKRNTTIFLGLSGQQKQVDSPQLIYYKHFKSLLRNGFISTIDDLF